MSGTTRTLITTQADEYGIEFGHRYRDRASGFEGSAVALYFFEHGCLRVNLRGASKTTGEPIDATFDAPELVAVATETAVPKGSTKGGPHDLASAPRQGIR